MELKIANSLWMHLANTTVLPSFTEMEQKYYGATIGDLAGAPGNVNAWVASESNGLITNVLSDRDYSDVTAIIANVVYFKGRWTSTFNPNTTVPTSFTLSDGTTTTAQMMRQSGRFSYLRGSNFQMVRLPYGHGRMSMLILLPDSTSGLASLLVHLTVGKLNAWIHKMQEAYGGVALPRFQAQSDSNMRPILRALGMDVAFICSGAVGTRAADFSALTREKVCVTSVAHKVWAKVDETGTVAAAATTLQVVVTSAPQYQFTMTMDHPFLYAIRDDDTGALLFIGTLLDPTK